jgi:hypothetical protein
LPVLIGAVPGDRRVPAKALDKLAVRYRAEAVRLPGHAGRSLLADTGPLDAVLDWLAAPASAGPRRSGAAGTAGAVSSGS